METKNSLPFDVSQELEKLIEAIELDQIEPLDLEHKVELLIEAVKNQYPLGEYRDVVLHTLQTLPAQLQYARKEFHL